MLSKFILMPTQEVMQTVVLTVHFTDCNAETYKVTQIAAITGLVNRSNVEKKKVLKGWELFLANAIKLSFNKVICL